MKKEFKKMQEIKFEKKLQTRILDNSDDIILLNMKIGRKQLHNQVKIQKKEDLRVNHRKNFIKLKIIRRRWKKFILRKSFELKKKNF